MKDKDSKKTKYKLSGSKNKNNEANSEEKVYINETKYSRHYDIKDEVDLETKDLNKHHFLWRNKNIFAIILTWITTIIVVTSIILGVSYAKNHNLITFGYDFARTSQVQIQNYVGNYKEPEKYIDDINNHRISQTNEGKDFLDAVHHIHNDLNEYFQSHQILFYDNIKTVDKNFFDPNAFVSTPPTGQVIDPQKSGLYSYVVSFNVGVNDPSNELAKIFKMESIKEPMIKIMDLYNQYVTPLIKNNPNLTAYVPPTEAKTWLDNWAKSTYDYNLFYYQQGATSQNILNELVAIFLTFIILTLILVAYFLFRYGIGSTMAIIITFLSYGILSIAFLICSSLVISGTSVIMIFSGFILMVVNLAIIMPVYMKIRKQQLMSNKKSQKELTSEEVYNIARKVIKTYKKIFILELLVIIIPTIIYLVANIIVNILNHTPLWIIFRYNISNELVFLISILISWLIFFIVFLPLWSRLQTVSIKFWRLFHYRAVTLKDDPEETSFDNLNNIQNNEELSDAFKDKDK